MQKVTTRGRPLWSPSEPEHVVEAEGALLAQEAVIAEEATGRVADDGVGGGAGLIPGRLVEQPVIADEPRAGAGNRQLGAGDFRPLAVVEDDLGGAHWPPRQRGRIDQVAKGVVAALAEAQEEPGRKAGGMADIGLR